MLGGGNRKEKVEENLEEVTVEELYKPAGVSQLKEGWWKEATLRESSRCEEGGVTRCQAESQPQHPPRGATVALAADPSFKEL